MHMWRKTIPLLWGDSWPVVGRENPFIDTRYYNAPILVQKIIVLQTSWELKEQEKMNLARAGAGMRIAFGLCSVAMPAKLKIQKARWTTGNEAAELVMNFYFFYRRSNILWCFDETRSRSIIFCFLKFTPSWVELSKLFRTTTWSLVRCEQSIEDEWNIFFVSGHSSPF